MENLASLVKISIWDYQIRQDNLPYKNETDFIINAAIEVYKALGRGVLKLVYKSALCIEFKIEDTLREKTVSRNYKKILLAKLL